MIKRTMMLATALLLAATMGCTYCQKFAAGGAAVGATVGGVWAASAGTLNAGEGAAIGAVTGGLAGALIGDIFDYKKLQECEQRIKELEDQNAKLQAELNKCKQDLDAANRKIAELEAELAKLREQLKNARIPALEISLGADVLFKSGSARLSEGGRKALEEAAKKIASEYNGKFIMIEGHTDSQPIKHSNWKSNWELGAARSLTVLHFLTDKGVDPAMLSAATFSKYQPVVSDSTKEGMSQNRRAVIVIYNQWIRASVK